MLLAGYRKQGGASKVSGMYLNDARLPVRAHRGDNCEKIPNTLPQDSPPAIHTERGVLPLSARYGLRLRIIRHPTETPQVRAPDGDPHKKPTDKATQAGIHRHGHLEWA